MTYKEHIHAAMVRISKNKFVRFIGYNTKLGHQMYGTLKGCEASCIETPVAENLMMGLAMGLSLEGFYPVVCFERSNFLLPALDAIINHLYGMPKMSGEFDFPVTIRVVIPSNKPLDPGFQHLGDYTKIIKKYTKIPVLEFKDGLYVTTLANSTGPVCIIEHKEKYGTNYTSKKL